MAFSPIGARPTMHQCSLLAASTGRLARRCKHSRPPLGCFSRRRLSHGPSPAALALARCRQRSRHGALDDDLLRPVLAGPDDAPATRKAPGHDLEGRRGSAPGLHPLFEGRFPFDAGRGLCNGRDAYHRQTVAKACPKALDAETAVLGSQNTQQIINIICGHVGQGRPCRKTVPGSRNLDAEGWGNRSVRAWQRAPAFLQLP